MNRAYMSFGNSSFLENISTDVTMNHSPHLIPIGQLSVTFRENDVCYKVYTAFRSELDR